MTTPKVFISYAHLDEPEFPGCDEVKWLTYVDSHLGPLKNTAQVVPWADVDLHGSQDWEARILAAIDACDIFILLVSRNALRSPFITQKEVPRILERQRQNNSPESPAFYPILITPCGGLDGFDWLKIPNMRPKDRKALSDFEWSSGRNERDRVMASIVEDIAKLAKGLRTDQVHILTPPKTHPKPRRAPTDLGTDMPPVSGNYGLSPAQQSQGTSGLDPVLREVLLYLAFTGLSRITTKHGTLVFTIRQALLHTTVTGGRIATTRRAFPEGWNGPNAQVTRIGGGQAHEILRIDADDGLEGQVLAARGDSGHLRIFDVVPTGDAIAISGEIQVNYEAVDIDFDASEMPRRRQKTKSGRRKQIEAELAKLILEECGLTRLPLEGHSE